VSSSVNKILIIGHLGKDPEVTYGQQGAARCRFSVATSERYKDREGKDREETEWHNVVVYGKQAEACGKFLAKGRQVYAEGRVQTRKYEKDGQDRYITELIARTVIFLGAPSDRGKGPAAGHGSSGDAGSGEGFDSGSVPPPEDDLPF
jgi:single-strand DNA-binding protein